MLKQSFKRRRTKAEKEKEGNDPETGAKKIKELNDKVEMLL